MKKTVMLVLVMTSGCARTHIAECLDHELTTGSVADQALPDGSTLEPWLAQLSAGVDVPVEWEADGTSATVSALVSTYDADAVSLASGDCDLPLLRVEGEAGFSLAEPVLELTGSATVWRAQMDELVSGLKMDLATVALDAEHEPFPGYDTVNPPLEWTFELFEQASAPGELLAVLTWSTGDNPAVVVDGVSYLRGRLFGTPGHPWTDTDEVMDPLPVP